MQLQDLEFLNTFPVAGGQTLYRVQRSKANTRTVRRGPLRLAPADSLSGRFDLKGRPVAYLAESPDTALYEAVFRREATSVSLAQLATRELVALQLNRDAQLGDLRPHAMAWPVLQSLRYGETRALAEQARAAGFAGLIYRSGQQFGQDCVAMFDPAPLAFKLLWRAALVDLYGAMNRWAYLAATRSRVALTP